MNISKQLVLPVLVMVVGLGVAAPGAQAMKAKAATAKVFFVEPKNGATVTSPVHMKFGRRESRFPPVPPGDVKTARPGMAHYHVGIDVRTACRPARPSSRARRRGSISATASRKSTCS